MTLPDPFQQAADRASALLQKLKLQSEATNNKQEEIIPSALWPKLEVPVTIVATIAVFYIIWQAYQQGLLIKAPYAYFLFFIGAVTLLFVRDLPTLGLPWLLTVGWSAATGASNLETIVAFLLAFCLFAYADSPTGRRHWGTSPLNQWVFGLFSAFCIWGAFSAYDVLRSGQLGTDPATYRKLRAQGHWRSLKIGLALSGGGYRAALLHAGALDALEQYGVAPTHIASASGGSILGAYYSLGGRPSHFKQAVIDDRFRLKRRLTNLFNLVPVLSCPGELPILQVRLLPCDISRTDIQEQMLHHMVLNETSLDQPPAPDLPRLIVGATDLNSANAIGITHGGALFLQPAPLDQQYPFQPDLNKRFEPATFEKGTWSGQRLARAVASSGAFPGAFAPISMNFGSRQLLLADGGMMDNSALTYLLGAAADPAWEMHVILASDGSKPLGPAPVSSLDRLGRAADMISGGFRSDLIRGTKASIQLLSPSPLLESPAKRNQLWDRARNAGLVGPSPDHLAAALDVFKRAGTLEDRYTARDADLLYHLGWYLVVLNWPEIRGSLDRALAARSAPAPLQ